VISPLYQHVFVPEVSDGFTPMARVVFAGRLAPPACIVPEGSRRNPLENSGEPVHIGVVLAEWAAQYGLTAGELKAIERPAAGFKAFGISAAKIMDQAGPTDDNLPAAVRNPSPRAFDLPAPAPALV
jgi:hypothetical protein